MEIHCRVHLISAAIYSVAILFSKPLWAGPWRPSGGEQTGYQGHTQEHRFRLSHPRDRQGKQPI